MRAAKGKRQVTLTLKVEDHDRLLDLANEADRTLAGYIRWVLSGYLRDIEKNGEPGTGDIRTKC